MSLIPLMPVHVRRVSVVWVSCLIYGCPGNISRLRGASAVLPRYVMPERSRAGGSARGSGGTPHQARL